MNCPYCNSPASPRKKKTGYKCVKGHKWESGALKHKESNQQSLHPSGPSDAQKNVKSKKDIIIGSWKSEESSFVGLKMSVVMTFRKTGSLEITFQYKNRFAQAILAAWKVKFTGSWEMPSDNKLAIELDDFSSYPSELIDQVLKTFKIKISAAQLYSAFVRAVFGLIGLEKTKPVDIKHLDTTTLKLGDKFSRLN